MFFLARSQGLDLVGLRDLTPDGSVSGLSRAQADELIDRLSFGIETRRRRPRRGRRASASQVRLIGELILSTGVSPTWLTRFGVTEVGQIRDRDLAARIIAGLRAMQGARDPRRQAIVIEAPG